MLTTPAANTMPTIVLIHGKCLRETHGMGNVTASKHAVINVSRDIPSRYNHVPKHHKVLLANPLGLSHHANGAMRSLIL